MIREPGPQEDPLPGKKALLARIPLFASFTSRELGKVASVAQRVSAGPGDVLAAEGEPGTRFFVIENGTVSVRANGRRIATLRAGDFFGEMALLDQGVRTATVRADSPASLYMIEAQAFGKLLDDVPFLTQRILRGVSNRLRATEGAPSYVWNRW